MDSSKWLMSNEIRTDNTENVPHLSYDIVTISEEKERTRIRKI